MAVATFRLQMVSLQALIYDGETRSVYVRGDEGEFELLPFHYPLMAALPEGEVKIWGQTPVPIRAGVVMFNENRCTMIVELPSDSPVTGISWSGLTVLGTEKKEEKKPEEKKAGKK
ncbi:MAG: F0F1 ATP synthase subunit epsilon [Candidatus Omnitrophota bacterium]